MDCRKGDLIIQRHNEVRDSLSNVAALAYSDVIKEPVVRETDESNNNTALIADLGILGVQQPQTNWGIIRYSCRGHWCPVIPPQTSGGCTHRAVLIRLYSSAERDKQHKYSEAVKARWALSLLLFPWMVF